MILLSSSDTGSMIRKVMTRMIPKTLMYEQIVSVVEAIKTAPTLSGAVLRRNLLDQGSPTKTIPVQRRVYAARKEVSSWTIALDH